MFELLEAIIDIIKYFGLALVSLAVVAFLSIWLSVYSRWINRFRYGGVSGTNQSPLGNVDKHAQTVIQPLVGLVRILDFQAGGSAIEDWSGRYR
jgi:hypothetical protein